MDYKDLISMASFSPKHLEHPNAWVGHLPFAAWLIKEIKPQVFVELGTHTGNSYFSFCQAVKENGIATDCYAIDTWKGDEHAGFYEEKIFTQVNDYNEKNYAEFSRLLRMTFDEAIEYFSDGTIDLLHIDGLHTYEAVKHDFETWFPKLTKEAIVMFHDTHVREKEFGVWKLWEELKEKFPLNLDFVHSNGLGIIRLKDGPPEKQLSWLKPDSSEKKLLKHYFAALGTAELNRFEAMVGKENEVKLEEREKTIKERDETITSLNQSLEALQKDITFYFYQIENLNKTAYTRNEEFANLNKTLNQIIIKILNENSEEIKKLKGNLNNKTDESKKLSEVIEEYKRTQNQLQNELASEREQRIMSHEEAIAEREKIFQDFHNTATWRLTQPLRSASKAIKQLRGNSSRESHTKVNGASGIDADEESEIEGDNGYILEDISAEQILLQGGTDAQILNQLEEVTSEDTKEVSQTEIEEKITTKETVDVEELGENTSFGENFLVTFTDQSNDGKSNTHYIIADSKSLMENLVDSAKKREPAKLHRRAEKVTVIIPVFRGVAETEKCISSVIRSDNTTDFRLVLINDRSPEPEMDKMLQKLKFPQVKILKNPENLGFVKTVNIGMRYAKNSDVILLNSDTIVSNNWIDRLVNQAYREEDIGTVTPFSNNATICSYPTLEGWSELPPGEESAEIDKAFSVANAEKSIEIPTAVGFCMYIKRKCLNEVGLFDEETFGRGYGEENDFCIKARNAGWKHILAADTFVFHKGEISFSESALESKTKAADIIRSRHPNYENEIFSHIEENGIYPYRIAATAARYRLGNKPVVLLITHHLGAGTEKHIQEIAGLLDKNGTKVLILRPANDYRVVLESFDVNDGLKLILDPRDLKLLAETLKTFGIKKAHIHHTVCFEFSIERLMRLMETKYDFTVHDYHTICPRIFLLKPDNTYCGVPEPNECNKCLRLSPRVEQSTDIYWWRLRNGSLLNGAEKVICPSRDAAERIAKVYPNAAVTVVPHEQIEVSALPKFGSKKEKLRFVLLGKLDEHKGFDILERLLQQVFLKNLPIEFVLIGFVTKPLSITKNFFETGKYAQKDIQYLIDEQDPDAILFLSKCPETYCYTLTSAIQSGRPVIVPDLGAFPERVKDRENVHIFSHKSNENELLNYLTTRNFSGKSVLESETRKPLHSVNKYYGSKEYWKVEERETVPTLLIVPDMNGIFPSACSYLRLIQPLLSANIQKSFKVRYAEIDDSLISSGDIFVTNRLPSTSLSKIEALLSRVKQIGAKLIYDIDDNLLYLPETHPERGYYERMSPIITKLLNEADLVWCSTDRLKIHLESFCKKISPVKNYLDSSLIPLTDSVPSLPDSPFKILYMGTTTHGQDLQLVLLAIRILNGQGYNIELHLIGVQEEQPEDDWVKVIPITDETLYYPHFITWLKGFSGFSLGIAPLELNIFNECKSDIKFWDYTAMGIPTLASNVGAYRFSIKDKENGLIIVNAISNWIETIKWATENQNQLKKLTASAITELRESSLNRAMENERKSLLKTLLQQSAEKKPETSQLTV